MEPGELNLRLEDMGELERSIAYSFNLPGRLASSKNFKNLEHLLLAAQQQQLRQLRRLQQLKRQTEMTAAQQAAWEEKEQAERMRRELKQAEQAEEAARKAAKAAEAEARRKAAQEAAAQQQEEYLKKLEEKLLKDNKPRLDHAVLEYERRTSAARSTARMMRTQARKEQVAEGRRAAVLAAEAAAERRMQQKLELRLLQEAIKREEDSLAEEHRREIQARAGADEAAKVAYYEAKARVREQRLQQRQEEAEMMRNLRAEESRARFEYIRSRTDAVNEQDMAKREEQSRRLTEKLQRAEALAAEREALVAHIKRTLEAQEMRVRQVFEKMAATGKLELPPELLVTLNAMESVVTSPYLTSPRSALTSPRSIFSGSPDRSPVPHTMSSPRRLLPSDLPPALGLSPTAASQLQRQQEAALQQVLEEEILKEMARENMLQTVTDTEERKCVMRQFAAEREAAKARILQVGNQLLTHTTAMVPGGTTGGTATA